MTETAYVALGSNMGDGEKNILSALEFLGAVPGIKVCKVSKMYKTKPWGGVKQDDFVNACAKLNVKLSPQALLGAALGVEAAMGRVRKITNGPRVIDIDILMYGDVSCNSEELILPHPRMNERDFVLIPLYDVVEEKGKQAVEAALCNLKERYVIEE